MNRRHLLSLFGGLSAGIVGTGTLVGNFFSPSSSLEAPAELQKQLYHLASRLAQAVHRMERRAPEFHLYGVVRARCQSSHPVSPALIQAACDLSGRLARSECRAAHSERLQAERFCRVARRYIAARV